MIKDKDVNTYTFSDGVDPSKHSASHTESDSIDITFVKVIEINVNEMKEIYMIKSSLIEMKETNKLSRNDVVPFIPINNRCSPTPPTSTPSSSSFPSSPSSSSFLFPGVNILLYNPDLADTDLSSFLKTPGRFSFMDELNCVSFCEDGIVETIGPKSPFLMDEVTLFVIKEEEEMRSNE